MMIVRRKLAGGEVNLPSGTNKTSLSRDSREREASRGKHVMRSPSAKKQMASLVASISRQLFNHVIIFEG